MARDFYWTDDDSFLPFTHCGGATEVSRNGDNNGDHVDRAAASEERVMLTRTLPVLIGSAKKQGARRKEGNNQGRRYTERMIEQTEWVH